MALPTTSQLSNQIMNESVREIPTSPMDGNVTRPMIISDLLKAMKDVNFNQLVEEYGSMAGVRDTKVTPMTNALMAERERVPETPLKQAQTPTPPPTQPTRPPSSCLLFFFYLYGDQLFLHSFHNRRSSDL